MAEGAAAVEVRHHDRFGITWHPSIAASVLANRDRLDLVEVIPEGRFLESKRARRALRTLARTLPVSIHGVSLGLASAATVEPRRLEALARLVGEVEPESWSEHLAFVRSGGIELGHLAAPPRTAFTVEATADHVEAARVRVGSYPCVENVATPIDPPGSDRSEQAWLLDVLKSSPANLLLDLHNLYSNGKNFGFDPTAVLRALPAERIRAIHIAGGVDVRTDEGEVRHIDDHLHDVPDPVYELLEIVGERVPHALDVVLERDGAFPTFDRLLAEIDRARLALARGRARASCFPAAAAFESSGCQLYALALGPHPQRELSLTRSRGFAWPRLRVAAGASVADETHERVERFLARLYTDDALRTRFLAAPLAEARLAGFAPDDAQRIARIDRVGLQLAAASFAHKRSLRTRNAKDAKSAKK